MSERTENFCPACRAPLDLQGRCIMGPRLCDHGWFKTEKVTQKMAVVPEAVMRSAIRSQPPPALISPEDREHEELLAQLAPPPVPTHPPISKLIAESLQPPSHVPPGSKARPTGTYPLVPSLELDDETADSDVPAPVPVTAQAPIRRFPAKAVAFGIGIVFLVALIILVPAFRVHIERVPVEAATVPTPVDASFADAGPTS